MSQEDLLLGRFLKAFGMVYSHTKDGHKGRLFIGFIIAVIVGPVMVFNSIGDLWTGVRSKSWPTTTGRIMVSEVQSVTSGRRTKTTHYEPRVVYDYHVNGEEFIGKRITLKDERFDEASEVEAIIRAAVTGPEVTVSYDPKSPNVSVLKPGSTRGQWLSFLFGVGVTGFAIGMGAYYVRGIQNVTLKGPDGEF